MAPPEEARYRIGSVARLTGVSIHALRIWERRYAAVTPARTAAGDRRYSEADVERLRLLKRLSDAGHAIGDIAHRTTDDLKALLGATTPAALLPPPGFDPENLVHDFLATIGNFDLTAAEQLLARACSALEPRRFLYLVLLPILERVGEGWETRALCVAHEHAASALIRHQLGVLLRSFTPRAGARILVAGTLSTEQHEFGTMMAANLAAFHGWRVVYLGPDLPAAELVRAARDSHAEAVLVSVVTQELAIAREQITELSRALPEKVQVLVGGQGSDELRGIAENVHCLSLPELESWLSQTEPQR